MAQYTLAIPSCFATDIRSVFTDTLFASMVLSVKNEHGGLHHEFPTQTASLGDYEPRSLVLVNMSYQNVEVPDPTTEFPDGGSIEWGFVLANAGHADEAVLAALNNAASKISGSLVSTGEPVSMAIGAGILAGQVLLQLLNANCDGVVAMLGLKLTAAELAQMTSDPQNLRHQLPCPGLDSPAGCGGNSNYTINYVIAKSQLVTVPNVIGMSPADARELIQQAGLDFSSSTSQIGPRNQPPEVDGQDPPAGSQVLQGSSVSVTIIAPVPPGHIEQ